MSSKRKVVRLRINHSDEIRKAKNKIIEISNKIMEASGLRDGNNYKRSVFRAKLLDIIYPKKKSSNEKPQARLNLENLEKEHKVSIKDFKRLDNPKSFTSKNKYRLTKTTFVILKAIIKYIQINKEKFTYYPLEDGTLLTSDYMIHQTVMIIKRINNIYYGNVSDEKTKSWNADYEEDCYEIYELMERFDSMDWNK